MTPPDDAWVAEDPTLCAVCGREACEEHLPADDNPPRTDERSREAETAEARAAHHTRVLAQEVDRERARREARRLLDAEERGPILEPVCFRMRDWLTVPDPVVSWRLAGWQPTETRVVLAAARKTGKTTAVASLVRSLLDGDPWLDAAAATPVAGTVAVLDTEMSGTQLRRWYRDQRIVNDDRLAVFSLKGQAATLDLLDATCRALWVRRLRAEDVCYLIVDNLRPILDALALDESHEAGRWLVGFDALLREAAIAEACVVHHMGHNGERSRGDSRLRDWPDVEWRMMRQDEDDSSARYIAAYGRDVDVSERQLAFDRATRRLSIIGGTRKDALLREDLARVRIVVNRSEHAPSGSEIKRQLTGIVSAKRVDAALRHGVETDVLAPFDGPKRAILYRLTGRLTESVSSVS